jgi:hypothetical protein
LWQTEKRNTNKKERRKYGKKGRRNEGKNARRESHVHEKQPKPSFSNYYRN